MSSSGLYFEIKWTNVIFDGFRRRPQFTQVLLSTNLFSAMFFMYGKHSCCVFVVSVDWGSDDTCSLNEFLRQLHGMWTLPGGDHNMILSPQHNTSVCNSSLIYVPVI